MNLAAIVWLYRGQHRRFLSLVKEYLRHLCEESDQVPAKLDAFEARLRDLQGRFDRLNEVISTHTELEAVKKRAFADAVGELREAANLYKTDRKKVLAGQQAFSQRYAKALPDKNEKKHAARQAFDHIAVALHDLIKQVDLLYKLAARIADLASEVSLAPGNGEQDRGEGMSCDRRAAAKLVKQLDEERKVAVEQMKRAIYFHRQTV